MGRSMLRMRWARFQRLGRDERGAASVELVLVAPLLAAVILLLVAGGRLAMAGLTVEAAAAAAARTASLATSSVTAVDPATLAAASALEQGGVRCAHLEVTVDAAALDTVLGASGSVETTVTCTVDLADVTLPGVGGTRTMTANALSPVDPYRERG